MKVDISRDTFEPSLRFSRVLLQQGRVQLDADFNEEISILLHYLRTLATDVIGPHGGPKDTATGLGFDLFNATMLAAAPGAPPSLPADFDVHNFIVGPGHYFVAGLLCELDGFQLYRPLEKPDPAKPMPIPPQSIQAGLAALKSSTSYVAYLDAWERVVTIVQDDHIREVALGGADTSARLQVAFQIRAKELDAGTDMATLADDLKAHPESLLPLIGQVAPAQGAVLRARVDPGDSRIADEVCTLPPDSKYRGDENQLYRVEIHTGGPAAEATFVWARDNASIVFPIISANGAVVILESLGRDFLHGLEIDDWVEFVDDGTPAPGVGDLYQVSAVNQTSRTVTLHEKDGNDAQIHADAMLHPFLRRWDYSDPAPGDSVGSDAVPPDPADDGTLKVRESSASQPNWIDLEDGVQIQFRPVGATYLPGDYWLIPARTATGNVEWPTQTITGKDNKRRSVPAAVPARHVDHAFAPLWLFQMDGAGKVSNAAGTLFDLRRRIEPIAKSLP